MELANTDGTYHAAPLEHDVFHWHFTIRGTTGDYTGTSQCSTGARYPSNSEEERRRRLETYKMLIRDHDVDLWNRRYLSW